MEQAAVYAYRVYMEKSFTKAAKELYISQPALSATISRLEKELGFCIFNRSRVPLNVTPEGQIYIEMLEEMMESENAMRRRIGALSDLRTGSLTIGGQSDASNYLMAKICGAFYRRYPKVRMKLDIGNKGETDVLWEKLKNNQIDLFFSYTVREGFIAEPICTERLYIAMHRSLQGAEVLMPFALSYEEVVSEKYDPAKEIEDPSRFGEIAFLQFSKGSVTGRRMAALLRDYKEAPFIIENARHSGMHYNLMAAGLGATLASNIQIAQRSHKAEELLFFALKNPASYRKIYLMRNPLTLGEPLVDRFIEIAKETCAK